MTYCLPIKRKVANDICDQSSSKSASESALSDQSISCSKQFTTSHELTYFNAAGVRFRQISVLAIRKCLKKVYLQRDKKLKESCH